MRYILTLCSILLLTSCNCSRQDPKPQVVPVANSACPELNSGMWYLKRKIEDDKYPIWDYDYSLSVNRIWEEEIRDYLYFKPNGERSSYWYPVDSVYMYYTCTGTAISFRPDTKKKTKTDPLLVSSLASYTYKIKMLTKDTLKFKKFQAYTYDWRDTTFTWVYDHRPY